MTYSQQPALRWETLNYTIPSGTCIGKLQRGLTAGVKAVVAARCKSWRYALHEASSKERCGT
jgi:hypothetical protein